MGRRTGCLGKSGSKAPFKSEIGVKKRKPHPFLKTRGWIGSCQSEL